MPIFSVCRYAINPEYLREPLWFDMWGDGAAISHELRHRQVEDEKRNIKKKLELEHHEVWL